MYKDRKEEKKENDKEFLELDDEVVVEPERVPTITKTNGESSSKTEQEGESQVDQPDDDESDSEYSDARVDIDDSDLPQEVVAAPELRRSTRVRKPIQRLCLPLHHILYTDAGEPESYDEAMSDNAHLKQECAMKDEMSSLEENHTWELVKMLPKVKVW